jgi:methyl-accepting chemotaxis protein
MRRWKRRGQAKQGWVSRWLPKRFRSLAQRSAHAAREIANKVVAALAKTRQGVELSGKVDAALGDIVIKAHRVDELAGEVANASNEQTQGITQINSAIGQMDHVMQNNAAKSEESAAAAADLHQQATLLQSAVSDLRRLLKEENAPSKENLHEAALPAFATFRGEVLSLNGHGPITTRSR